MVHGLSHAHLIDLSGHNHDIQLGAQPGMNYVALSPDGEWAATGAWQTTGAKVWNARTGKLVKDLPTPDHSSVRFSPDGTWLVTSTEAEYRFWRMGTWEPGPRLPGAGRYPVQPAFSPDGRTVAVAAATVVRLLAYPSLKELATLEPPSPSAVASLCFSPDGGRLAVACMTQPIYLWDLRLVRERLRAMGLDWNLPAPPARVAHIPSAFAGRGAKIP